MNSRLPFSLRLLGSPSIQGPDGALLCGHAAQRHRIALLALLARSPERGLSRDKVMAYLWPESDAERARNLLKVSIYVLRKALGEDALLSSGDQLRLNPQVIGADVATFDAALLRGEHERAVAAYEGPFLDGFFLSKAPEFEHWVERERDRLADSYATALEALADAAEARRDFAAAAVWWKARAAHDPYDSRVARRLMQSLEVAGNRAAALQHASIHERLLEDEFGLEPDPATRAAVEAIRQRRDAQVPCSDPIPAGSDAALQPAEAVAAAGTVVAPATSPMSGDVWARLVSPRFIRWGSVAAVLALVLWGLDALVSRPGPQTGPSLGVAPAGAGDARDDYAGSRFASERVAQVRSIAVLPFVNLSPDPEEEYFSDGLAEELIGALGRISALRVAARTSSFAFRAKTGDIRQIGDALNVATVLEGSFRRDGDRVIVQAQLIDVADGLHLWSETYERRVTEIFEIQRELALQIAVALEAELTPGERERLASRYTPQLGAYTSFLKARHFHDQRTPMGYERAIEYFQRAITADPLFAAAHAGLAGVYALQGMSGALHSESARTLARTAALRAIDLDEGNAEAHTVLGLYLHAYAWDASAAEREFQRSIALDPNYPPAHQSYGNLLSAMGRIDEAVEQKRRAVELDPLVPALSETLAFTLVRAGRLDEANRHVDDALELDSTYWRAHAVAGLIHEMRGETDNAIRAYERANALARSSTHRTRADIARALARSGSRDQARRLLMELRTEADASGVHEPSVATVLLALGESDAAFAWLERAFRQKHPHLAFIGGDARFSGFDGEPRYANLMRRVGMGR